MQNNWSKSKRLHKKSQFNARKIGWNTFMHGCRFVLLEIQYGRWPPSAHLCIYTSVRLSRARSCFIRRHKLELIFRRTFCQDPLTTGIFSCNIQSSPLNFTLPSVAYCMKLYRAVTWWWFPGPLYRDSTLIFFFARYNVELGRVRDTYKTRHNNKKTRTCIILWLIKHSNLYLIAKFIVSRCTFCKLRSNFGFSGSVNHRSGPLRRHMLTCY